MRGLNQFISESIFDADFDALDNELNKDWLEKNNRGSIKKVTYSPDGIEGEGHLIFKNITPINLHIAKWKGTITLIDCTLNQLEGLFADGAKVDKLTINGAKGLTTLANLPDELKELELLDCPDLRDLTNTTKVNKVTVMAVGKKRVKLSKLQAAFPKTKTFSGYRE